MRRGRCVSFLFCLALLVAPLAAEAADQGRSVTRMPAVPGLAEHGFGLKRLDDAVAAAFEHALRGASVAVVRVPVVAALARVLVGVPALRRDLDHAVGRAAVAVVGVAVVAGLGAHRSEERRVGKEGRSRWAPYH